MNTFLSRFQSLPFFLLGAYVLLFAFLGIAPYSREVWLAENGTILAIVLILVVLYWKGIRFSNTAYLLMSVLIFLHTIGGHYTFERVPFDWFDNFFGFERNMYDRVGHFTVGFYAFAIAELLVRFRSVSSRTVFYLFPIFSIAFIAMSYEIIEWLFAALSNPEAGLAFLGSQGDMWDAQEDMLADILGAFFAMGLFLWVGERGPRSESL